jgi:hypothetical protein
MEVGRKYRVVMDASGAHTDGTFVEVVSTEIEPGWAALEGWWLFDVLDRSAAPDGATHPVFVNPARALTVIPAPDE